MNLDIKFSENRMDCTFFQKVTYHTISHSVMKKLKNDSNTILPLEMIDDLFEKEREGTFTKLFVNKDHLDSFEKVKQEFSNIHDHLISKHFELSETETNYCLLTVLDFTVMETSELLYVSRSTVKNARNRIKERLMVPKGIALKQYLKSLLYD